MEIWFIIIGIIIIVINFILENVNKAWIYDVVGIIGFFIFIFGITNYAFSSQAEEKYKEKLSTIPYYEMEIDIALPSELNEKGLNSEPMFNGLIDAKYEKVTIRNGGNYAIITIYYGNGTNKAYTLSEEALMKENWYTIKE